MKITFLVHGLPVGGTERVVADLARWLRGHEHQVDVACLDQLGAFGEALQADGIPCTVLGRKAGFDRSVAGRLAAHVAQVGSELIHAHQYTAYFYAMLARSLLARPRTRLPVVFTEHGRFHPDTASFKRRLFNRTIARPHGPITAVTEQVKTALVTIESLPAEAITILPNGLDPDGFDLSAAVGEPIRAQFGIPLNAPLCGTVARLEHIKRQDILLEAFALTLEKRPDAHLLIVGDGPMRRNLTALCKGLNLSERVHLAGSREDIPQVMAALDLFVLTSASEGMPMTLLEAMAARVAIVTTDVGSIGQMLENGQEAVLVPPPDDPARTITALATQMSHLLATPDDRLTLTDAAHARLLQHFTLDRVGQAYLTIYRQAVDGCQDEPHTP